MCPCQSCSVVSKLFCLLSERRSARDQGSFACSAPGACCCCCCDDDDDDDDDNEYHESLQACSFSSTILLEYSLYYVGAKSPPPGLKSPTPSLQANAAWSHVATNKLTLDQGPLPPPPGLPPKPSAVPPHTMRWSDYPEDSDDDSVAITVGNGRQRDIIDDSESDDELGRTRAMTALRSRRHEDEDEDEPPGRIEADHHHAHPQPVI